MKKTATLATLLGWSAGLLTATTSLRPIASLAQATCAQPFREAMVTKAQQPAYPKSAKVPDSGVLSSVISITVDVTGRVVAGGIYKSSGNADVDNAALQAAYGSSYAPKLVNCKPVVGNYLFRADFDSDNYAPVDADLPRSANGEWENPFCGVSAIVVPWNAQANVPSDFATQTYAVYLWANATSNYTARLTLVSRDAAYAVEIPKTEGPKGTDARARRSAYLVSLPAKAEIEQYFVDAAGLDGAAMTDCPSFVKPVEGTLGSGNFVARPAAFGHLDAQFVQTLTTPACGSRYTPLTLSKFAPAIVGRFGQDQKVVEVEAFVDSAGHVVKADLWRSSGIEGLDNAAIGQFGESSYHPATFLCTPVVSSGIFAVRYEP